MHVYNIESLPSVLIIGRQTETGVTAVGFDCTAWLERWPGLSLSLWPTAPKSKAAYPALCHMVGGVLVWDVKDSDTAQAGEGLVEIMGTADGVRKLSAVTRTRIFGSTLTDTADPPEAAQPWVDQVLDAAKRAEEASGQTAEQIGAAVERYLDANPPVAFETDETLTFKDGVLSVNTADVVEQDNTRPVTSAAVHTEVGNINALLATI